MKGQSLIYKIMYWVENWDLPFYKIKWFIQRGRRGYSDRDLWALDGYLSFILKDALIRLASITHGHPCRAFEIVKDENEFPDCCKLCDCKIKWDTELRENAERFRLLYEDNWYDMDDWAEQITKTQKEALEWLSKWYGHLWD